MSSIGSIASMTPRCARSCAARTGTRPPPGASSSANAGSIKSCRRRSRVIVARALEVEEAGVGGGHEHRALSRHLVREDRQVAFVADVAHDVEVGERGLDQQAISAFVHVELPLAARFAAVAGGHLVALAIAE